MSEWIKCSDSMPNDDGSDDWILVYVSTGSIEMALYDALDGFTDGDCYSFFGKVTHWQPLPSPPKD